MASTTDRMRALGTFALPSASVTLDATDEAAVSGPTAVGLALPATA